MLQRCWRETYTCSELAYAVTKLKYTLFNIEEGLLYDTLLPIFKDFMQLMSSLKIRYSKIPTPRKGDLEAYCQEINEKMKFKQNDVLKPSLLSPNEFQCSFIKG